MGSYQHQILPLYFSQVYFWLIDGGSLTTLGQFKYIYFLKILYQFKKQMSKDPKQTLKEGIKNVKDNLNNMKDNIKDTIKDTTNDMTKDKMGQNTGDKNQSSKNFKDNLKQTIKKPKIEIPPIPKSSIGPAYLGLIAAGLAGAYYYFYYRKPKIHTTQTSPINQPRATQQAATVQTPK